MLGVPGGGPGLRPPARAVVAVRAGVGDCDVVSVCASAGEVRDAWDSGGAYSLESWQAAGDHGDDGVSGPVGPAAFLARDGAGISDQLGGGLSVGGMVCRLGFGASEAPRG